MQPSTAPGTGVKTLLAALAGHRVDPPPVWLMRQAGRYLPEYRKLRQEAGSFLDLCLNPTSAAEVTLQPVRRFGVDAAIVFADILLIPRALGQALDFIEGDGPRLEALQGGADLARLKVEQAAAGLAPIGETLARVKSALPPDVALIGFAGAPWTVAAYMIGGGKGRAAALHWLKDRPDAYARLNGLLVETTVDYLSMQVEAGAEALQIFDSWAGDVPPSQFGQVCIEPMREITTRFHVRHPGVPLIGFPRGVSAESCAQYARETGIAALSLDESHAPQHITRMLPPTLPVQGNLSPSWLEGDGEGLDAAAAEICRGFAERPHIFNLGHGIRPTARPENVARLIAAVRNLSPGVGKENS